MRLFKRKDKGPRVNRGTVTLETFVPGECRQGGEHDFVHDAFGEGSICLKCHLCHSILGTSYLSDEQFNNMWNTTGLYHKERGCVNPEQLTLVRRRFDLDCLGAYLRIIDRMTDANALSTNSIYYSDSRGRELRFPLTPY